MVMIYTLVSEAQECLENMIEELASQEQDKKLKLVQAEEEQEQVGRFLVASYSPNNFNLYYDINIRI